MFRWIFRGILAFLVLQLALLGFILWDGNWDRRFQPDAIVVLGAPLTKDGLVNRYLEQRLQKAADLFNEFPAAFLVVSGQDNQNGNEVHAMANRLRHFQVPDKKIIEDGLGDSTFLTAKNVIKLARIKQWDSLLLVSQGFHLSRTKLAFVRSGFKNIGHVAAANPVGFNYRLVARELIAYNWYLLRQDFVKN